MSEFSNEQRAQLCATLGFKYYVTDAILFMAATKRIEKLNEELEQAQRTLNVLNKRQGNLL